MKSNHSNQLQPQQLVTCIDNLISCYQETRSPLMALSICQHIQALYNHPECESQGISRCHYQRMGKVWKLISQAPLNSVRAAA